MFRDISKSKSDKESNSSAVCAQMPREGRLDRARRDLILLPEKYFIQCPSPDVICLLPKTIMSGLGNLLLRKDSGDSFEKRGARSLANAEGVSVAA